MTMTKKALAELVGYTARHLGNIDRDLPEDGKLFVAGADGKYDVATFVRRWVDYNVEREKVDAEDFEQVKARHESVKMQKSEIELMRMRGELVDTAEVELLWADIVRTTSQRFLYLPAKVAPTLVMMERADAIEAILDKEVRDTLTLLAGTPLPEAVAEARSADEGADGS